MNKEFDNKCTNIYQHIQILKKKEENYQKKLLNLVKKEVKDQKIHEEKQQMKSELKKKQKEKNDELNNKKEKIKQLKNEEQSMLKETKDNNINMKKRRYQSALNDKRIMKNIRQELDKQQNNKNCFRHAKVKQEFYEGKANKIKQNLEKKNEDLIEQENDLKKLKIIGNKMMKTYSKLEMMEQEYLKKLEQSKKLNEKYMDKKNISMNL